MPKDRNFTAELKKYQLTPAQVIEYALITYDQTIILENVDDFALWEDIYCNMPADVFEQFLTSSRFTFDELSKISQKHHGIRQFIRSPDRQSIKRAPIKHDFGEDALNKYLTPAVSREEQALSIKYTPEQYYEFYGYLAAVHDYLDMKEANLFRVPYDTVDFFAFVYRWVMLPVEEQLKNYFEQPRVVSQLLSLMIDSKNSLLSIAAGAGCIPLVKLLLKNGAEIDGLENDSDDDMDDPDSLSPLFMAVRHKRDDMVAFLLKQGADTETTWDQETPLMKAAELNLTKIAKLLIDAEADINANGFPLAYAIQYGHLEIVQHLLDAGVDVTQDDLQYSHTPLEIAIIAIIKEHTLSEVLKEEQVNVKIFKLLLAKSSSEAIQKAIDDAGRKGLQNVVKFVKANFHPPSNDGVGKTKMKMN